MPQRRWPASARDALARVGRHVGLGILLLGLFAPELEAQAIAESPGDATSAAEGRHGEPGPSCRRKCDVDADGDVDLFDILLVVDASGTPATERDDPRDATGDGWIDAHDWHRCRRHCTLPGCARPPRNHRPVADAGRDRTVPSGSAVTLDGSGSSDADGDPLRYRWKLVVRPEESDARLSERWAVMPTFVADRDGTYVASLVVDDCRARSAPDEVTIVAGAGNVPPVADAGPDQTVPTRTAVRLDGTGSSDADGDPLTFAWSMVALPAGSTAVIDDPAAAMPGLFADLPGEYVVQLVVDDGQSASVPDSVEISTVNSAPVADAGPDQTVFVTETVSLDGGGSTDIDGDLLTFRWALLSSPAGSAAALSDPAAVNPRFTADVAGEYVVQLIVDDGFVDSAPDTVIVSTRNSAPVADAGPDRSTFVGSAAQLDGSGSSDVDGDPLTFAWSFLSVPAGSTAALSDPAAVSPTFSVDLPGSYVVQLTVDDGVLASVPDTVTVTTENRPPVAAAGADQTVPLGATVQLDGSGSSDPDGDPLTFAWSLASAPAGSVATLSDPGAPDPTFTADRPGTYVAQLVVDDGWVDGAPDTVSVSTENSIPIADAGPDQTVTAGTTVQLDGGASADPDGTPLLFSWSLTSRPAGSAATLSDPAAVDPTFVADLPGVYVAQLIVDDGVLASEPDTAMITAEEPVVVAVTPTDAEAAEAGPDPGSFRFTRIGPATAALTVFFTVAGSAANGTDYEAIATRVTLPAGATTADLTITPIDDGEIEGTEFVTLILTGGPSYTVGTPDSATVSIADDDLPVVTVGASDPDATEAGPTPGAFTFARTGDPAAALLLVVTKGGTAEDGNDYASLGGATFTVTIPAGQPATTVIITPLADNRVEAVETVILTLVPSAEYIVGSPGSATVSIADDPPIVTLTATDADASEQGPDPGVFTFARSGGDLTAPLSVGFSIGGTAANNSDYAFIPGNVAIPADQATAPVVIAPLADNRVEGEETVVLTILAGASYMTGSPNAATVTIADNPPVVTVAASDPDASEAGLDPGLFTFTRSGGNLTAQLQIFVSRSGTATAGLDYASFGGSTFLVTFAAGQTSAPVAITPLEDSLVEGPETVVLTIQPNASYTIGAPGAATVTIADDD